MLQNAASNKQRTERDVRMSRFFFNGVSFV